MARKREREQTRKKGRRKLLFTKRLWQKEEDEADGEAIRE
jgi:hypothetical protein